MNTGRTDETEHDPRAQPLAENEYRELDASNLPVDAPTDEGNDVILAAYRMGTMPEQSFNHVSIVGTGGSGLYEREWRQYLEALTEKPWLGNDHDPAVEHVRRAMQFASEVAIPYETAVRNIHFAFYLHTDTAHRQKELFNQTLSQALTKAGKSDQEIDDVIRHTKEKERADSASGVNGQVAQYVVTHPEDWESSSNHYVAVCRAIVELGENDVMTGLLEGQVQRIAQGRRLMATAAKTARLVGEPSDITKAAQHKERAYTTRDPDEKAAHYRASFRRILATFFDPEDDDHRRRTFLANALMSDEFARRQDDNISIYADLDPVKAGGAASHMRNLSDDLYRKRQHGPMRDAATALAEDDQPAVAQHLKRDHRMNKIMHATALRFQDNPPNIGWDDTSPEKALEDARRLESMLANSDENAAQHPEPAMLLAAQRQAVASLRAHANTMTALAAGDTSRGTTMYHLAEARRLEYFMQPEVIRETLEFLKEHPNWRRRAAEDAEAYHRQAWE